ncbi:PD40 domain-containing protein [Streptomyces sp. M2CJ-2]|uniref:TolB family protein n=1 Tax=Streptomyces sp. M2CJ-2 TaxID=2803948 RepID=UPI001928CB00|nr:PD40 domain-containing protein [Streptomyces sp. M2CJ-2]MBL3669209.1 PD40 domain-containing protein [Streptomyces sp. M2CJ-2]
MTAAAACVAVLLTTAGAPAAPPDAQHGKPGKKPRAPHSLRLTQGADGASEAPSLSADGRYAVFTSSASNLVPGDTNGAPDVFLRDLRTGRTQRVSTDAAGGQSELGATAGAISANGRYAVFVSASADLIPDEVHDVPSVYRRDLRSGEVEYVGNELGGSTRWALHAAVSADGRYVAFASSSTVPRPGAGVGVRDMRTGELAVQPSCLHRPLTPQLSDDGRALVYTCYGFPVLQNPPSDVVVADPVTGARRSLHTTPEGARGNGRVSQGGISGDGRYASFTSTATDLGPEDTNGAGANVFVRDLRTDTLRIVEAPDPTLSTADGALSGNGRYLLFRAFATEADAGTWYLRDLRSGRTRVAIVGADGTPVQAAVAARPLDARARAVAFSSAADDLAPGARSPGTDAYVRRLP